MQKTLSQILSDIGAYVDQDTTLPTGTELTVRVNLVNQALLEWSESYQWAQLRIKSRLSFTYSGASFALPTNFKKLMSPVVDEQVTGGFTYVEIRPEERFRKVTTDKYCYILGDEAAGKSLTINPRLDSGFSGGYDMQVFPSSMATLQDISVCPQPDYLVRRTIAAILESRSDVRFPQVKADAQLMLDKMIEEEDTPSGGKNNVTRTWPNQSGFVIGED